MGGKFGVKKETLFSLLKTRHCHRCVYVLMRNINNAPNLIVSFLQRKEIKLQVA